ncbi:hypothetical protein CWI42_042080 [Ordospora colligata]|uniref:WD40 domain-containing protein n=1 Tax=Ordospora colligata OC4 TaxID=1354746 RepID=A0A0B2UL41_9MICR|nr:uncharacterized protein M896_042090 [Ordospora colligata OC4]KHN70009.1 hypothetical protein M896_042090 [Ordospora colligata OC4]TBU16179.1 hypothetical protein CWI41_042080 [Ordospora colligata]TBU16392.1 hypothetical protein CWI40_042080 [Ordospora colligata]TBU19096.1 hypothetical protein CWI42_042080 [Ordospora colligata]
MILTDKTLIGLKESKPLEINTYLDEIEYSTDGLLLSITHGNTLKLFSALSGNIQNIIHLQSIQKYLFMYPNTIVHTSCSTLQMLSVFDNKYIRTFNSHKNQVYALSVCTSEDSIISSSNECINYWDVRKKNPLYKINAANSIGCISSSYDYALLANGSVLKIYDKRNIKGPRSTSTITEKKYLTMAYSPDANHLVISDGKTHLLADKNGLVKSTFALESKSSGCITPDSSHFLLYEKNHIFAYNIKAKKKEYEFEAYGIEDTKIRFNPCYTQFAASSSKFINIWAVEDHTQESSI